MRKWPNNKRSSDVEDLIHVLEDFRVCQKVLPVSSGRRKWTKVHQSTIRNLPTLDFQLEGKILSNFRRPFLGSAVNSKKWDFAPISIWTPYSEKNLYKLVKIFSNIWALFMKIVQKPLHLNFQKFTYMPSLQIWYTWVDLEHQVSVGISERTPRRHIDARHTQDLFCRCGFPISHQHQTFPFQK